MGQIAHPDVPICAGVNRGVPKSRASTPFISCFYCTLFLYLFVCFFNNYYLPAYYFPIVGLFLVVLIGVFIILLKADKSHRWKYVFILLLIGNLLFGYWAKVTLDRAGWGISLLAVIPPALTFVIVDAIAVLSYVSMRFYHSRSKAAIYAALIPAIFILLILAGFLTHMIGFW